ncbi:MAG TPA: ATP-binding protein [Gemmatimonadaceae bacterium]|nr:ATP-binding protein [Gemmatimonadaceae bacterium]
MSASRHEHPPHTPGELPGERPRGGGDDAPPRGRRPARPAASPPASRPADLPVDAPTPRRRATDFANPLHDALATLAIGLAVVDAEWTLAYVNDALAQLVDRPASELTGHQLADVFPTLHGGVEHALIRRTRADGVARSFRVSHERSGRTFEVRAARSAGRQLVLEVRDATTLVRLEREHERAMESIGETLFIVDTGWRITYWNAAAERLTGLQRAEVIGRDVWEMNPWLVDTPLEQAYREAMIHRTAREILRWNGVGELLGRVFDVRCYPVPGNGLLVLVSEVSEELRREVALAEASGENALLRELAGRLAHTPDSEALLGMLCEVVRRECRASGAGVCAVQDGSVLVLASIGKGVPQRGFTMPLRGSLTADVVATRRVLRRRPYRSADETLQRITEADLVGENMIAPLVAYDQVVGVIVSTRLAGEPPFGEREERLLRLVADHAALALWKSRLLEQAQAANEAKSAFLATMSHELRTPITAITGYGELLTDESVVGPLSEVQQEMVDRMCAVTQHLSKMIDELLTYSSLEAGREVVRAEAVGSADLLRSAVAVAEPVARQKGLAVHVLVPPDAPVVRTDPDKARQILMNLADNAVKFTREGAITLSLTAGDGMVRFGVRDTGIGIPEDSRTSLFQPFMQVDASLTRRYGGSGLGLYISSRLAGLLGGRIEVESTPGKGSLFELVLPLQSDVGR